MRMLCIMSMSNPPGHLTLPPTRRNETEAKQVARMCHSDARQVRPLIDELETRGVFDRDNAGNIVSRRMIRDAELSDKGRSNATKGWANRKGQPKGQPNAQRPNGEANGSHERDPMPRTDTDADSLPRGAAPVNLDQREGRKVAPLSGTASVKAQPPTWRHPTMLQAADPPARRARQRRQSLGVLSAVSISRSRAEMKARRLRAAAIQPLP